MRGSSSFPSFLLSDVPSCFLQLYASEKIKCERIIAKIICGNKMRRGHLYFLPYNAEYVTPPVGFDPSSGPLIVDDLWASVRGPAATTGIRGPAAATANTPWSRATDVLPWSRRCHRCPWSRHRHRQHSDVAPPPRFDHTMTAVVRQSVRGPAAATEAFVDGGFRR